MTRPRVYGLKYRNIKMLRVYSRLLTVGSAPPSVCIHTSVSWPAGLRHSSLHKMWVLFLATSVFSHSDRRQQEVVLFECTGKMRLVLSVGSGVNRRKWFCNQILRTCDGTRDAASQKNQRWLVLYRWWNVTVFLRGNQDICYKIKDEIRCVRWDEINDIYKTRWDI